MINIGSNLVYNKSFIALIFYAVLVGVVAQYLVGVTIVAQLKLLLFLICNILFGCFFLNRYKEHFRDKAFYYLVSFLLGVSGYFIGGYILMHRFIQEMFQLPGVNISYVLTMFLSPIIGMGVYLELKCQVKLNFDSNLVVKVLAVAFLVWVISYAGFKPFPYTLTEGDIKVEIMEKHADSFSQYYNEVDSGSYQITERRVTDGPMTKGGGLLLDLLQAREAYFWGNPVDKYVHLGFHFNEVTNNLFPLNHKNHRGLQIYNIIAADFAMNTDSREEIYYAANRVSLLIVLVIWFAFIYSFAFICFKIFALNERYLNLVIFSATFFEVLMFPFSSEYWGAFKRLFSISESLYFNVTHLYSAALGMVAMAVLLLGERAERKLFIVSSFLVVISFFFKPSLFVIAAPSFCLFAFLGMVAEKKLDVNYIKGVVVLFLVPVFFLLYKIDVPANTEIVSINNLALRPFLLFRQVSGFFLPSYLQVNSFLQIMYVFLLGFAAFVPFALVSMVQLLKARVTLSSLRYYLLVERESVLFLTLLFVGLCSGLFLVEDSYRLMHMNFSWSLGIGYMLAIPYFLNKVLRTEGRLHQITIAIIYMHIAFGIFSLLGFCFFI